MWKQPSQSLLDLKEWYTEYYTAAKKHYATIPGNDVRQKGGSSHD